MRIALFTVVIVFSLQLILSSATIHVPGDYTTIQEAIDAAVNGDVVLVDRGIYVENIDFIGKSIRVTSSHGPEDTIIDGGNPVNPDFGSVVTFSNGEDSDAVLDGFTVTNGTGTYFEYYTDLWGNCGGGVFCYYSFPSLSNNIIVDNSGICGGGVFCYRGKLRHTITECHISRNHAEHGGGIFCYLTSPTVEYCTIEDHAEGGGFWAQIGNHDEGVIQDSIIQGNHNSDNGAIYYAGRGGGIYISGNVTVRRNIITGNSGKSGGGIYAKYNDIIDNIITHNIADGEKGEGGGIYIRGTETFVNRNHVAHNLARLQGGGIRMLGGTLTNCVVCNNTAGMQWGESIQGGGLALESNFKFHEVSNCMVYKNHSYNKGGGIYAGVGGEIEIVNFTLVGNTAIGGAGVYGDFIADITLCNSIFWDDYFREIQANENLVVSHCNVIGGWPGAGNIDADPLFVDPSMGDFHLTYQSPCRDLGDNSAVTSLTDFEGNPRIGWGCTVDIGADEYYTHLYYTGFAAPGKDTTGKLIGLPGTIPVGLFFGSGILEPPLPTAWGNFHLQSPLLLLELPSIPSNGVLELNAIIPHAPPAPYDIPMQALIGLNAESLSNLCVLEVR